MFSDCGRRRVLDPHAAVGAELQSLGIPPQRRDRRGPPPKGAQPETLHRFVVSALDRATGKTVWETVVREEVPHEPGHITASQASASPVIDGESLAVEIFIPGELKAEDLLLEIGKISHLFRSPLGEKDLRHIGSSGSCEKDMACSKRWQKAKPSCWGFPPVRWRHSAAIKPLLGLRTQIVARPDSTGSTGFFKDCIPLF